MTARAAGDLHVLVTLDFPESFLARVRGVDPSVVLHHHPAPSATAPTDEPATVVPADVLALAEVMYTSDVLPGPDEAPRLRWAQLDTSGIDQVRMTPLWQSEVTITTLGGVSPAPLAEWILMMVLAHAHHLRETERLAAEQTWPSRSYRWNRLMPRNLRASTVGIVGYGRIGKEVARLCRALGMEVMALRRGAAGTDTEARYGVSGAVEGVIELSPGQLDVLLGRSDYVVLTVPLTDQTRNLLGEKQIAGMKEGAVLVNASRGGVVDEEALLAALDSGHVDLVASDVFEEEPLPAGHPFWTHPRSVVTPHVAGFAPDYLTVVADLFTSNLRRYLAGEPLLNVADRARGY